MAKRSRPLNRVRSLLVVVAAAAALALAPQALRDRCETAISLALAWPATIFSALSDSSTLDPSTSSDLPPSESNVAFAAIESSDSLLVPQVVRAHVLGRLARRWLDPPALLGAGADNRLTPDALVLAASSTLIDRGSRDATDVDQLVLAGRHIWGKVVEVGPSTALVRHSAEQGYRDVVQLAHIEDDQLLHRGPRGLLEGCGQPQCRIRYVETTESVSVGDWVVASGLEGLVEVPLVYGRIARAEHASAEAYWELWMEPATPKEIAKVEVLVGRLQETQVAHDESATRR